MDERRFQCAIVLSLLAAACGSRSPLGSDASGPGSGGAANGTPTIICHSAVAASETINLKSPLYMEIILDGSGSMSDDHKWIAAVAGLDVIFDDFLMKGDPTFAAGLIIFSDRKDPTVGEGPYPTAVDVAPAFVDKRQHALMRARLDRTTPGGGTPTYRALRGGFGVLHAFEPPVPQRNAQKIVVLLTDGVPTGPLGVFNSHEIEQAQCLNIVNSKRNGGIRTFAVGIGPFPGNSDYDPNFMGDLAVAGGTRSHPQCDPHTPVESQTCHIQVSPLGKTPTTLKREFITAVDKIRDVAGRSCEFAFTDTLPIDPAKIHVDWNDGQGKTRAIGEDTDNGWTFEPPRRTVVLHGQACAELSSDFSGDVSVRRGC